jgi:hypothetical protein
VTDGVQVLRVRSARRGDLRQRGDEQSQGEHDGCSAQRGARAASVHFEHLSPLRFSDRPGMYTLRQRAAAIE